MKRTNVDNDSTPRPGVSMSIEEVKKRLSTYGGLGYWDVVEVFADWLWLQKHKGGRPRKWASMQEKWAYYNAKRRKKDGTDNL